ncbi:hypothetical protein [Natronomonas sp. EA1]|uniref:hypothetical protein n=1 Tax=Natronomonas sp. EA1 TaxID=3421655 RepID=UPI003EB969E9
MARTVSMVALWVIVIAAVAWIAGGVTRVVLIVLGEPRVWSADVGGLVALTLFILLGSVAVGRRVFG